MKQKKVQINKVAVNPFDKFSNSKKKHDVLNRRVKGEDRNVGRALAKAVDVRKKRLLTDYNKNKKSSSFIDKRFGENDTSLSLEDKMLARFQKERLKKSRNSSIFNLDSNVSNQNTLQLTHKGQVLSDANYGDNDWSSDDDENDALGKDLVNQLHFGGGMVPAKSRIDSSLDKGGESLLSTKINMYGDHMTALQEIVAKSKLHKLQKKEMKQELQEETDKVDSDFQSLLKSSMIEFRDDYDIKTKKTRRGDNSNDENLDEYDKAFHQMSYEAKVQPTDRTKSLEEIAIENRSKLDDLEKKRLERMRKGYDPSNEDDDEDNNNKHKNKKNGKKNNQKKSGVRTALTDDDIDEFYYEGDEQNNDNDDEEENDEDDNVDDDEEENDEDDNVDDDEEENDEDDNVDDDEEENDEDDNVDDDEEENDEDDNDDDDEEENDEDDNDDDDEEENDEDDNDDDDNEEDNDEEEKFHNKTLKKDVDNMKVTKSVPNPSKELEQNIQIPHKIFCPDDMQAFDVLLKKCCKTPLDNMIVIDRILLYNSIHLPGQLGIDNKKNMPIFLDILVTQYIRIADSLSTVEMDETKDSYNIILQQMDHLVRSIFKLSQDIPDACVALWIKRLKMAQQQFQKKLRDYTLNITSRCWPSLGNLLSFQLLGLIFSTSDYRNSVVEGSYLMLSQYLSQSPINDFADLSSGLLCVCIMMEMSKESKRLIPEIFSYLGSVYGLFSNNLIVSNESSIKGNNHMIIQKSFNLKQFTKLRLDAHTESDEDIFNRHSLGWQYFKKSSSMTSNKNVSSLNVLTVVQSLTHELIDRFQDVTSFQELFDNHIIHNLKFLRPHDAPKLSPNTILSHTKLLEKLVTLSQNSIKSRHPLKWRKPQLIIIETKNPRFQVDYKLKRDNDPDENRVKLKQLTRQKKREEKAAMRELRRDSDFLEQEKYKDKLTLQNKTKMERHKNFSWMEEQAATINLQVRKGGELLRGGGSGGLKKPKTKR